MIREPERRVAMITICALLGIALYLVWQITAPFWSGIFLGIVLGISGYPIHAALERRWRKPALAALRRPWRSSPWWSGRSFRWP